MTVEERRKKRRKKKSNVRWGRLLLVLLVFLALVGVIVWGTSIAISYVQFMNSRSTSTIVTNRELASTEKTSTSTVSVEQKALDKPIYILLIGKGRDNQADSLFLMSVNLDQHTMDIIGIPSNSKIESRDQKSVDMLNTMYSQGGIDLTKAVVEDMFHISIPYYVVVDESAFIKTNDVWGNKDFYVEENMQHTDANTGIEDINLRRGYQTLDSEQALGYLRYSEPNFDTLSRVQHQERYLKLMVNDQRDSFFITNAWRIWRIWNHYESNISTFDAMKLLFKINRMDSENIHFYILLGEKETINNKVYWNVNPTEAQHLVGIMMGDLPSNESADYNTTLTKDSSKGNSTTNDKSTSKDSSTSNNKKTIKESP